MDRLLWWVLVAGVVVIPCAVSPTGQDSFRFPKLLLFRAEGIVLVAAVAIAAVWGKFDLRRFDWHKPAVWLPLAIVVWTAFTTCTSHQPLISVYSLLTVVTGFTVYLLTSVLAKGRSYRTAAIVLLPAAVNALIYWLQRAKVWNPLVPDRWTLETSSSPAIQSLSDIALQGNRNDVGTFLVLPALLAIVLTTVSRGRVRYVYASASLLLCSALVVSRTLTAIIALSIGIAALGMMRSWRLAVASVTTAVLLAGLTLQFYPPLHARMLLAKRRATEKKYNELLSGRLGAFVAAQEMAVDHPLLGVGPGLFAREFLNYKIRVDEKYGGRGFHATGVNFGEAHNDHLQTLDETGVPGYAGFAGALIVLGSISFRRRKSAGDDPRWKFARQGSFPVAISFAVLAMAQFPLQLAATLVTLAFAAGLMEAWSEVS